MSVGDILTRVTEQACPLVEVTGGEPLTQPQTPALLRRLCDAGFETLLETNGSLDISQLDPRVVRIVDFKCPASGHHDMNLWSNADSLTERDEVKFVITDRDDYQFARTAIADYNLSSRCPITFSPAHTLLDPAELAAWILTDQLPVRMGLGLHKLLWPDRNRGV